MSAIWTPVSSHASRATVSSMLSLCSTDAAMVEYSPSSQTGLRPSSACSPQRTKTMTAGSVRGK